MILIPTFYTLLMEKAHAKVALAGITGRYKTPNKL